MLHLSHSHPEGAYYYMIFNLIALIVGVVITLVAAWKSKIDVRSLKMIVAAGILGAIIGSKLIMLTSAQWLELITDGHLPLDNSKSVVGAILGGMIVAWSAGKWLGNKSSILDLCAVSLPLALAVQRIGCLIAGCCHGMITDMPWGITYAQGTKPYLEQQQAGLITPDAISSLPVHPDQLYTVLAGLTIAFLVWKTRNFWKSPSGQFIFSVMLLLTFRFIEEFSRFHVAPQQWMGLEMIQWKIIFIMTVLGLVLYFREQQYTRTATVEDVIVIPAIQHMRAFCIALTVLFVTLQTGGWLSADERTIILLSVIPLCVLVISVHVLRVFFSPKYVRAGSLMILAFALMSQKVDAPKMAPVPPPPSYTAFELTTAAGSFNLDHEFNYASYYDETCDPPTLVETRDNVPYDHSYKIGGIGVSRKIYYNQWQSLLAAFRVYGGAQKITPKAGESLTFDAPTFNNTLIGINPMLQFDTRGIGVGVGASIGLLGNDVTDNPNDHADFNPKTDARKSSLQARVRFFSERLTFLEIMGGYDLGSVGEYNWQFLLGTRFNGHKHLLKGGLASSRHEGKYFVMHGQVALSPRFFITPQLMVSYKNNTGPYSKKGYRAALGIEYRINDK